MRHPILAMNYILTINAVSEPAIVCCPSKLESCKPIWPIYPTRLLIYRTPISATRHFGTYSLPNRKPPPINGKLFNELAKNVLK